MTVTVRTRETRLARDRRSWSRFRDNFGDDSMSETCPRCGWPCTHLVQSYYTSPWNSHGGICTVCCQEAERKFERDGWPADPREEVKPQPQGEVDTPLKLEL